jgi:two-component system CheB/CheR fusion protein
VILLDIAMPRLHGYEVARRLRELPGTRDTLIWALTGHGREEDRRRALEAGCDLHLVKPFAPAALRDLLEGVAQRRGPPEAAALVPA